MASPLPCRSPVSPSFIMSLFKFCATFVFLSSALLAQCGISQKDFSGVGHVLVLNSSDWRYATPKQTVGCLDNDGRFIAPKDDSDCGTYTRLDDYPYTLSSKEGNCTFNDAKTEKNTDSYYGGTDHAWTCNTTYEAIIYDELYTIVRVSASRAPWLPANSRRMASRTSSSVQATSTATTTQRRYPDQKKRQHSGSSAGVHSSEVSHLATSSCSFCGPRSTLARGRAPQTSQAQGLD